MKTKEDKALKNENAVEEQPSDASEDAADEKALADGADDMQKGDEAPATSVSTAQDDNKTSDEVSGSAAEEAAPTADSKQPEATQQTSTSGTSGAKTPDGSEDPAMALLDAKAQLAAFKSGVKPDAVEDAVCLAIHDAKKAGTVDEGSVSTALKGVLKRHPEWQQSNDAGTAPGFRIGADGSKSAPTSNDAISKIFGNK